MEGRPCDLESKAIAREAGKEFKGEIGRADAVLEIEKAVKLRHAIPPASHEGGSCGREERRELVVIHVIVADVVVAGPVEAGIEHLPSGFQSVTGLKRGVQGRVA